MDLLDPAENQILVATEVSAVSPGTELAVYTGTHQWLLDPNLPEWKFPFRSGYSAAGTVIAVGRNVTGIVSRQLELVAKQIDLLMEECKTLLGIDSDRE